MCFGSQGFARLKELKLKGFPDMKSVSFRGVMPHLEFLFLENLCGLRIEGITNLRSLRELKAKYMGDGGSILVREQLDQHPNRPKLNHVW